MEGIRSGWWGSVLRVLRDRLEAVIRQQAETRLRIWKSTVSTVSGAHAWIRRRQAPQWAIRTADGGVVGGRAAGVEALASAW
eukprot:7792947-Alexandrium_andersonii.AAC.1